MKYVIGVDVGTQGTKTCVFDEYGTPVASASCACSLLYVPGGVEQCPNALFDSMTKTVAEAVKKGNIRKEDVVAIGVDAQMAGVMAVDKDFQAVGNYDSWLDTRCDGQISSIKAKYEQEYVASTGGQVTYAHGPKILRIVEEYPERIEKIKAFVPLSAYLSGRLCALSGEDAYYDTTHLHFSGFADNESKSWNPSLCEKLGVNPKLLPRILAPIEVIGRLSKESAEACGLTQKVKVVAGCGDSAASALGAGVIREGIAFDVAGTASIFSCSTKLFSPDFEEKTLLYARSVVDGLWNPLAYIGGGGMCLSAHQKKSGLDYATLNEGAEKVAIGSDGLIFVPHFAGRVCPNQTYMKGAMLNLKWSNTVFEEYRAIMESIAAEYRRYYEILKENGMTDIQAVYGVGGGAKSKLFAQIKANMLKTPYYVLNMEETGTFGAALTAGVGAGVYGSFEEICNRQSQLSTPIQPQTEYLSAYDELYARYQKYGEAYEEFCKNIK